MTDLCPYCEDLREKEKLLEAMGAEFADKYKLTLRPTDRPENLLTKDSELNAAERQSLMRLLLDIAHLMAHKTVAGLQNGEFEKLWYKTCCHSGELSPG